MQHVHVWSGVRSSEEFVAKALHQQQVQDPTGYYSVKVKGKLEQCGDNLQGN